MERFFYGILVKIKNGSKKAHEFNNKQKNKLLKMKKIRNNK